MERMGLGKAVFGGWESYLVEDIRRQEAEGSGPVQGGWEAQAVLTCLQGANTPPRCSEALLRQGALQTVTAPGRCI